MIPVNSIIVLDTNILMHYMRDKSPVKNQVEADHSLTTRTIRPSTCVVTVGEAYALAQKNKWGTKRTNQLIEKIRELNVIDINNDEILKTYAFLDRVSEHGGNKMGKNDLWIAAVTSVAQGWLITTDKDFDFLYSQGHIKRVWYSP